MSAKAGKRFSELSQKEKAILTSPAGFVRLVLKLSLHEKQEKVLNACGKMGAKVVARCANEVGKTSRIGVGIILWWLFMFERGFALSTAGAYRQVKSQLVPNLKAQAGKFPLWQFNDDSIKIADPKTGLLVERYLGFSTNDAGKFEGFHGDPEAPLLIVLDEAKTIKADIFAASERCNPQVELTMSSPGDPVGPFYDRCTKQARFYQQFKLTQAECPWHKPEEIAARIERLGVDNPLVASMIRGEFMEMVEGALLSLAQYEDALENKPKIVRGDRHVFLDFAGGGDENAIGVRHGNEVWLEDAWKDGNTMAAVGRFITKLNKLKNEIGLKPEEVEGDADGLGLVMLQRIQEAGWDIREFHGGAATRFDDRYHNLISEIWGTGCKAIADRRVHIREDNEELRAQLISRKSKYHSTGKLWIEEKKEMKKRGLSSPDRADVLLGAIAGLPKLESFNAFEQRNPLAEMLESSDFRVDESLLAGMDAGS